MIIRHKTNLFLWDVKFYDKITRSRYNHLKTLAHSIRWNIGTLVFPIVGQRDWSLESEYWEQQLTAPK